jgi:hypothetical protein
VALGNHLAHCATITWTNTSGGFWSDATNWSPNQVPGNTDNALITTPGTYTVTLDLAPNFENPVTNAANLTLGAGGGAAGVQTFLVTNLSYSEFHVASLLQVTYGGVLTMTNDFSGLLIANPLLIEAGGVFNGQGENLPGPLVIANGGVMNSLNGKLTSNSLEGGQTTTLTVAGGGVLNSTGGTLAGPTTVANGGRLNVMNVGVSVALTVAQGGVLNVLDYPSESLGVNGPLTNSGTINVTNGGIGLINTIYGGTGGLVNQKGGLINFRGNGGIGGGGNAYLINQGMITASAGTNSINCQVFDNSQGTVTNLSGMLTLGLFQTNLTGTYFASAGATIQFVGADIANDNSAPQLTLGTPLVLGGSGQYQLTSGYLYLPANVPTNLELLCDTVELGPNFQGGAITNLTLVGAVNYGIDSIELLNTLPVTGTLTVTNCEIATNVVVTGGGVFAYEGTGFLAGTVTVDSGGIFNVINPEGNMYDDIRLNQGAIVAHGGIMNCEGYFTITTLTNAGTLNLASQLVLYTMTNGIVNQPGGLINLESNAVITVAATNDYFINQGSIVQNAGVGATNSISYLYPGQPFQFDNSQGTITNLSGTLVLTSFQSTLAGTFYAAVGATIQLGGGTTNAPLVPGTPLVLRGSGQYQFISGYLYAPANVPPNLSLQGGWLELGPGFQGGAITNLTLDGMELTNQLSTTLPIKGKFIVLNSGGYVSGNYGPVLLNTGVYGNYVVVNGGFLSLSNAAMYGAVTVSSGGMLMAALNSNLNGDLTIAGGGVVNSSSASFFAVTVASGGLFNSLDTFYAYVGAFGPSSFIGGPLNNSGTINMTNSGIQFYNNGTTNAQGCLINQAGGLIDFWGNTAIGGSGGNDYIANQGRIIKSGGSSFSGFDFDLATNAGTITAETGQMVLGNQWTLLPSDSLNVVLNSATNYGSFIISTNFPSIVGNAALAGAFNATLNAGYVPTNGTRFNVLTYGSFKGRFSSLGLPAAVSWQSNYGGTNFSLVVGSGLPQFAIVKLLGTNLVFNGTGGTAGSNYVMLASTNLTLPLTHWTALVTNIFDDSGQFHYTNHVSPGQPHQFFIFKLQ